MQLSLVLQEGVEKQQQLTYTVSVKLWHLRCYSGKLEKYRLCDFLSDCFCTIVFCLGFVLQHNR